MLMSFKILQANINLSSQDWQYHRNPISMRFDCILHMASKSRYANRVINGHDLIDCSGGSVFLRIVGQAYTLTIFFILLDRPKTYARHESDEGDESRTDSTCKLQYLSVTVVERIHPGSCGVTFIPNTQTPLSNSI